VLLDLDDPENEIPRGMSRLTLSFLMDRGERLPMPMSGEVASLDSLEARVTISEKDAKEFISDVTRHKCFVFAVSTLEYQFRSLIRCGAKENTLEQPVMEFRNLH
jgi:hypothetical protein